MIQVMVQGSNIFIPFNVFYFFLSFSSPLLITFVYLLCSLFLSYFFQLSKVTFVYLLFLKFLNYFFQLIELTSKDIMNKRCNIVVVSPPLVENTRSLHIVMLPPHCFFLPFTISMRCVTFLPHPTCGLIHMSIMNRYDQV